MPIWKHYAENSLFPVKNPWQEGSSQPSFSNKINATMSKTQHFSEMDVFFFNAGSGPVYSFTSKVTRNLVSS